MLIDAALTPADIALLPERDLSDATCVVFDILRATSSMITGLAHGVTEIHPVATIEEALALREKIPDCILGGERHGHAIEGFDIGNNPLEYTSLSGRRVVTTTTNGTVALASCQDASRVLVGALLNLAALHDEITRNPPSRLVLVCAGTFETFALEDALAAGELAQLFHESELTDAARACVAMARAFPSPLDGLTAARNGLALAERGWDEQIEWCAQVSRFAVVGAMIGGIIRKL